MNYKVVHLLILPFILMFLPGCKVSTTINLPTDTLEMSPDYKLILNDISRKRQTYTLPKSLFKKRERKRALNTIEGLSDKALSLYIREEISREVYDAFHNEAKYVLQQAIYMMRNETNPTVGSDPILDYLNTGINSLNDLLTT